MCINVVKAHLFIEQKRGFTLIEFIVVIVLLATLSVVVSTKYINLTKEAKAATLNTMSASLDTAVRLIQSKAMVRGLYDNLGVDVRGTALSFNGYNFTIYNQGVPREIWHDGFSQLIQGNYHYLGAGSSVIDKQCNTEDICIIDNLKVSNVIAGKEGYGIFFFPKNTKLSDQHCFAYYAFQIGLDALLVYKEVGAVTSGCS